jgi:lincosamide nucleotidyltransferase A/C/D/E
MVHAQDVISIYQSLSTNSIQVWLTGGWGIDALLREQTRPHKDLDFIMLVDDVARMRDLLGHDGYTLKELWSENSWVVDAHRTETPTAFVLQDAQGRQIDAHAMHLDDRGNGVPAWADEQGLFFTREDLSGEGTIGGLAVRCISPKMQMLCHTGYDLPDEQLRDLEQLHERFGVEYPKKHPRSRQLGAV